MPRKKRSSVSATGSLRIKAQAKKRKNDALPDETLLKQNFEDEVIPQ
jgi:hypothetical protein